MQWKFLGRRLGLEETELQRIEYENPRDLSEQCYQTLVKWKDSRRREETNYEVLFAAVKSAESERLRNEFVEFVVSCCLTDQN